MQLRKMKKQSQQTPIVLAQQRALTRRNGGGGSLRQRGAAGDVCQRVRLYTALRVQEQDGAASLQSAVRDDDDDAYNRRKKKEKKKLNDEESSKCKAGSMPRRMRDVDQRLDCPGLEGDVGEIYEEETTQSGYPGPRVRNMQPGTNTVQ